MTAAALFVGSLTPLALHAQPQITAQQLANLQKVAPSQIPRYATFWQWYYGRNGQAFAAPLPMNPYGPEVPVYFLQDGEYLIDNGPDDLLLAEQQPQLQAEGLLQPMDASGTTAQPNDATQLGVGYAPGTFYICSVGVTNQVITLVLINTVQDTLYEIESVDSLTNTADWVSEGTFPGLNGSTPFTFSMGNRTNQLWLRAKSWVDSTGSGIPDFWMMKYFGADQTAWPDPYADLNNDGYTVLDAYHNGWDPSVPHTPRPPQNVLARMDATGTNVIITWSSGGGPVSQYAIENSTGSEYQRVSASTFGYTNSLNYAPALSNYLLPEYRVRAYFTDGTWAVSPVVSIVDPALSITGGLARGPGFGLYLVISPVPQGASVIRLISMSFLNPPPIDIPVASFQNGTVRLTNWALLNSQGYNQARAVSASGAFGSIIVLREQDNPTAQELRSWRYNPSSIIPAPEEVFVNASHHIKENLRFLLRSASVNWPFSYYSNRRVDGSENHEAFLPLDWMAQPEKYYVRQGGTADYEYSGFHVYSPNLGWSFLDEMRPVQENCLWNDFVLASSWPCDPWQSYGDGCLARKLWGTVCPYQPTGTDTNPPCYSFSATDAFTLSVTPYPDEITDPHAAEIGLTMNPDGSYTLQGGVANAYGLPLSALADVDGVYYAGDTFFLGWLYACFAPPALSTVDYYFASQTPYLTKYPWVYYGWNNLPYYEGPAIPIPGSPAFTPTNTSPLLITGIGQPITVSAWARMAIDNADSGHANKFGFLEQYLDHALVVDQNGNTNQAGIVSPYGGFFPTMPGQASIVTMPDVDTGQRGTGVVNVIKLQLDVNHDGNMDLSFGGPDNTSQARPFVFWVNNDFDRYHVFAEPDWNGVIDEEEDDLLSAGSPGTVGVTPDCDYQWASGAYAIPSVRDLEDYTRLWIPGLKQLYEAHPNLSFELSIRNNDTAEGPAINLVLAAESDGGTRYLTDTNVANDQISLPSARCIGRISPNNSIRLNDFFKLALYPGTGAEHFIWCGARRGQGELVLQVKDGTNLLAETSAWLDLKDIKEMYERWTVGDNGSRAPTNTAYRAAEDLPVGITAFQYGAPENTNTPYIVHAHGWNMSRYDKDRYAETAFKRLYWQGYQGRFGSFRWPTQTGFTTFDTSEFNAWKSGEGLYRLLTNLSAIYPGRVYLTAHSMGNIVAAEALRKAGAGRLVNTYVAMQAAIASHAYDPAATNRSLGVLDSFTPDRLTEYWTNGAPCYLSGVDGAAHFANFFNPRDWALSWWETDQNTKPDIGYSWAESTSGPELYFYQTSPYSARQLFFPQDTYEIFSFITEGRCYALGAQTNVAGPFTLSAQVDLDVAPFSFGELHKGHSGEFRSTNMQRWPFWEQVLFTMELKAAQ